MKGKRNDEINEIAKKYVLDAIRDEHPAWVDQQGGCAKCEEYYEGLSDMITIEGVTT